MTDAQGTHEAARLVNLSPDGAQLHAPQAGREAEVNMLEYGIAFRNITTSDALWLKGLVYRSIAEGYLD